MIKDILSIYTIAIALEAGPDDHQKHLHNRRKEQEKPFPTHKCLYVPTHRATQPQTPYPASQEGVTTALSPDEHRTAQYTKHTILILPFH